MTEKKINWTLNGSIPRGPMHQFLAADCVKIPDISPNNLLFTNHLTNEKGEKIPVTVQILVGRVATLPT